MVERVHRTLKERLRARSPTADWMTHLPLVLLGLRSSLREDAATSPAKLLYGVPLRLPGQLLPGLAESLKPSSQFVRNLQEKTPMPTVFHSQRQSYLPASLASCSHVFVRIDAVKPPLTRPYEGPYRVLARSLKTYTLDRLGKAWVPSVDRLKPAFYYPPLAPSSVSPGGDLAPDLGSGLDPVALDAGAPVQAPPTPLRVSPARQRPPSRSSSSSSSKSPSRLEMKWNCMG